MDPTTIKEHARDYFVTLFAPPESAPPTVPVQLMAHTMLEQGDIAEFNSAVQFWETTRAMRSMKPFKAPGPDGFQPFFF